jgi:FMN reductase
MIDDRQDGPLVVGIGGSTRAGSVTNRLLQRGLDRAAERGARTLLFAGDRLATLPIFTGLDQPDPGAGELANAVAQADAVVIATPGYHGGMSGLVKNALDHLELLRDDPRPYLDGRAVGVIVTASGWQAAGGALASVRSAIHALRGWPTPFGVAVNSSEAGLVDPDGRLDERTEGALAIMAGQLMDFVGWRAAALSASAR